MNTTSKNLPLGKPAENHGKFAEGFFEHTCEAVASVKRTMKETIHDIEQHPWSLATDCDDYGPRFSHCEIEHHAPLSSSENPIVNGLISSGYEVHETTSTYFLCFPPWIGGRGNHFAGRVWHEFQVRLGDDGYLRFRFERTKEIYLSLFFVHFDRQGTGCARKWFRKITDALFRAGAESMCGRVLPTMMPAKQATDVPRLIKFYEREAGFKHTGGGRIRKNSPYTESVQGSSPQSSP